MSINLRFPALARAAVLSAALAIPAVTAARADGDFNISREDIDLQSAKTASPFKDVRTAAQTPQDARVASSVPMVAGKRDLVGAGGQQDRLANEIYRPGHTVGVGGE